MFNTKIILASASPRRSELLTLAGIPFDVRASNIEEVVNYNLTPEEIVCDLAKQKAAAVHNEDDNSITLGADTIVLLGNAILGKPIDAADAKNMLQKLSGKMHNVITGVALAKGSTVETFSVTTNVFFKVLSKEQINYYVETFEPMDKAGSYAIQEFIGAIGIEKIEGDYYNVVGLPIQKVYETLNKHFVQ